MSAPDRLAHLRAGRARLNRGGYSPTSMAGSGARVSSGTVGSEDASPMDIPNRWTCGQTMAHLTALTGIHTRRIHAPGSRKPTARSRSAGRPPGARHAVPASKPSARPQADRVRVLGLLCDLSP